MDNLGARYNTECPRTKPATVNGKMATQPFRRPLTGLVMLGLLTIAGCSGETSPPAPAAPAAPTATDSAADNAAPASDETPSATPAITDAAPTDSSGESASSASAVTLQAVDVAGYRSRLSAHKGRVILVDYWATYCVPCRKQFPHTVELSHQLADDGLTVLSMCCDEPEKHDQALKFLTKMNATFENLRSSLGGGEETFVAFEIEGGALPHYKLYDRTGKLRHTFGVDPTAEEQFTPADIEARIRELLAE